MEKIEMEKKKPKGQTSIKGKEIKREENKKWTWKKNVQMVNQSESRKEGKKDLIIIGKTIKKNEQEKWIKGIMSIAPKWIESVVIIKKEIIIYTSSKNIYPLMKFLKKHTNTQYKTIVDITAVDNPDQKKRFEVIYNLLSIAYSSRIRIKTIIDEITPIESITKIYKGGNWMERETWDMFGIYFYNHPDLRRILTDYGFDGFPLLKNWPLSGYMEVRYDDEQKRVINEPIEITQEFRNFDIISPWVTREEIED
jgi:NADH dehydrogenase (ubiquinone) Fe-S protein 3